MSSLFRRKSADVDVVSDRPPSTRRRPRPRARSGYTPEQARAGRGDAEAASGRRRPGGAAGQAGAQARTRPRRASASAPGGRRGCAPRRALLLARDRGPERALVRDIVDSRRTVGTCFFGGALIVLLGSNRAMPPVVQLGPTCCGWSWRSAWSSTAILISRKVKRLVRERFPNTTQRNGSLYLYAIMRSLTFRRMRVPNPRVKIGDKNI